MKPILFSTPMVQAILDGRKTMTRRVVKKKHDDSVFKLLGGLLHEREPKTPDIINGGWMNRLKVEVFERCKPKYQIGDTLWVRETWYYENHMHDFTAGEPDLPSGAYSHRYVYKASNPDYPVDVGVGPQGWKPSIHMPKEAARLFLQVTEVRVERLQEITQEDIECEGLWSYSQEYRDEICKWRDCVSAIQDTRRKYWKKLWDGLNEKRGYGWDTNPWVWVIKFGRTEGDG